VGFNPKDPKAEHLEIEKIPDLIAFYYKQKEGTAPDPAARNLSIMNRFLNYKLTIPPAFPIELKFDLACKVLPKLKPFHATGSKEISRVGADPSRLRLVNELVYNISICKYGKFDGITIQEFTQKIMNQKTG